MTEAEWLACDHPYGMLELVKRSASDRQRRLFACGCCRNIWPLIAPEFHEAVTAAESFADGHITGKVRKSLAKRLTASSRFQGGRDADHAAVECLQKDVGWHPGSHYSAVWAAWKAVPATRQEEAQAAEYAAQADLLRCIFGNPFRPIAFDPAWRSETVVALAVGIYAERAFDRLPILADALEEAGCDHSDILAHCRGPGPHARGCWVVDLVLNKA